MVFIIYSFFYRYVTPSSPLNLLGGPILYPSVLSFLICARQELFLGPSVSTLPGRQYRES